MGTSGTGRTRPTSVRIDRAASAERIRRDIEAISGAAYTRSDTAICRYAFTDEYQRTLDYVEAALVEVGFRAWQDPVGNFIARNCPDGELAFGMGSHCDSNRSGGKFDGSLGVITAVEVARLNREHGIELPLQVVAFVEEEASGFGQAMLGSRIMTGHVTDEDLRDMAALDDGESFWTHAERAGLEPARWRESGDALENLLGWIELHIEQGRVLQDSGLNIGVVDAIVGLLHADIRVSGRADHAGATPMDLRLDAGVVAAATVVELERLAREAGDGVVATVGELSLEPGLINVVPDAANFSIDVRGPADEAFEEVARAAVRFARDMAKERGMEVTYTERSRGPAASLSPDVVEVLSAAADDLGLEYRRMISGACHDTMWLADRVPSAMVFVPCLDGISHSPDEQADPADAALGAELMLNAALRLRPPSKL